MAQLVSNGIAEVAVTLEFRCFGSFSIKGELGLRKGPARARGGEFLEYLTSHPHAAVSRATLCEAFWPEDAEQNAHRLHIAASGARSAIRGDCHDLNPILFADGTYAWNPAIRIKRDTDAFERCWSDGSTDAMVRGTALYVGPFLAGEAADWIQPLRVRYEHLYVSMLERLALDAYRSSDFTLATSYALDLTVVDRAHERATQLAMICLAKSGRRGHAVREYDRLKCYLQTWIGVTPTAETDALLRKIIAGDLRNVQL